MDAEHPTLVYGSQHLNPLQAMRCGVWLAALAVAVRCA